MTEGGTTQAHMGRELVGCSARKNGTLKRTLVEVRRGADFPNPPQGTRGKALLAINRGRTTRKHLLPDVARRMKVWGNV